MYKLLCYVRWLHVSITVLYSFSYFQAKLAPINTKKFCYSFFQVYYFIFCCNKYRRNALFVFIFVVYNKAECENRTPEHISLQHLPTPVYKVYSLLDFTILLLKSIRYYESLFNYFLNKHNQKLTSIMANQRWQQGFHKN